jgi:hypothetical protein
MLMFKTWYSNKQTPFQVSESNLEGVNIFSVSKMVLHKPMLAYDFIQNIAKWKQPDITTIQNHNKLKKGGITARTSEDYRRGTRTQTILVQDLKY